MYGDSYVHFSEIYLMIITTDHRRRRSDIKSLQLPKFPNVIDMYGDSREKNSEIYLMIIIIQTPQTEEIGLEIISTAKISDRFSQESLYISITFSRESPKFETGVQLSKRSPRHSKENPGKLDNLEIQMFQF